MQDSTNHPGNSLPVFRLDCKLLFSTPGNRVKPGLTIVLRCSPLRINPALLLQPQQRVVHSALVQGQNILTHLLDAPCNPKSMLWTQHLEGLQNYQIPCSLQYFRFIGAHGRSFGHCKEDSTTPMQCPNEMPYWLVCGRLRFDRYRPCHTPNWPTRSARFWSYGR